MLKSVAKLVMPLACLLLLAFTSGAPATAADTKDKQERMSDPLLRRCEDIIHSPAFGDQSFFDPVKARDMIDSLAQWTTRWLVSPYQSFNA